MRLTTGAATAAVIRHGQVLVPKEGNEGREKTTATTAQAQHPTTHSNTERERERQKNSQPSRFLLTDVIHHPHSSSVPSSRNTSSLLRIHLSFPEEEDQSPQSSSCTRTLHPSFILNEHQSPPHGLLLTEFIPDPYSSTILSRRTSVDYSQYTVTKVHPSSALFIHSFQMKISHLPCC